MNMTQLYREYTPEDREIVKALREEVDQVFKEEGQPEVTLKEMIYALEPTLETPERLRRF